MTILDVFDPKSDGWSFENWNDTVPFTWDLYRKTYLAINPTNDPVEAPLDVAYYEIFKNCSQNGNCGGLCLLALALFKYGGYMGYCSPPNFYTGTASNGPTRADLKSAINIMQARQFSAAGIRNFVDVVKSGDLNNAMTVYTRVQDGLASGDYCIISLANTLFGGDAHTIIPYRAEMIGGVRTIHVWDPNRPYNVYPDYYDADHNKIEITGPTGWSYNQNGGSLGLGGFSFAGSDNGWFFAIPTSLEIHKGRQPFSLGFAFTQLMTIFVSGNGAAVTQIEDADGRRLYAADRARRAALETDPGRRLAGVAPWPWPGGLGGAPPGELFFVERPPGSSPLTLSVRGEDYRMMHLSSGHLTEVTASKAGGVKDRIRVGGSPDDAQTVEVETGARRRVFDIHHVRQAQPGEWRSVHVRNAVVTDDRLRVDSPVSFDTVELSGTTARRDVDVEFRQGSGGKVTRRNVAGTRVPAGRLVRLGPSDWSRLSRGKVDEATV